MQVSQCDDKLYRSSKQKIPRSHVNDWKLLENNNINFLLHIPSSTLIAAAPETLTSACCKSPCPLCLFEEQVKVPIKVPPKIDISAIALNVIESCNLRCTYCFAGDGDYGKPSVMSLELAKKVINYFVQKRDNLHIIFFGGEPLLNFSLIEKVVKWCESQVDKQFTFGMTSNGVLLNKYMLSFIKRHNFSLKISYDGPLLQAKQRIGTSNQLDLGSVTEKKLIKYSEALSQLKSIKLRSTLIPSHLPEAFDNIISSLNSYSYRFAFARSASVDKKLRFSMGDVEKLNKILGLVVDCYLEKKEFHSLLQISNLHKFIKMIHHGDYHRNFCGAGINYLSVSTSGRFYLCHRFTEDEEEILGDIEEGLNLARSRTIAGLRAVQMEPCRSCWMRNFCGGGCFHEHKLANHSIGKVDPMFCLLQDAELRQSIRIYLHLKHEAPELLDRQ
ncbi:MAG: radical SAM protein [Oligoflexales bacterium]